MSALEKSLEQHTALVRTLQSRWTQAKSAAINLQADSGLGGLLDGAEQRKSMGRYGYFSGWTYSTIHLLATRASEQPLCVGRIEAETEDLEKRTPAKTKQWVALHREKMPPALQLKTTAQNLELVLNHAAEQWFNHNPLQTRGQLVYMFVANLALTGRAYLIRDVGPQCPVIYCLPSSWVVPQHKNGPYSEFRIIDPKNPMGGDGTTLKASQVGMAYIPDPSDPLGAISPASSQAAAIKIDANIQECQQNFFRNGMFPSHAITIGKQVSADSPQGDRPLLTGTQRQGIHAAINRMYTDSQNYGLPIVLDALVESIEPLDRDQDEIGWHRSEGMVRSRIVSPFGVHPFLLGEAMSVGGYAQAAVIDDQFCDRVNYFLGMLSELVTRLYRSSKDAESNIEIWWQQCAVRDPSIQSQNMREGRKNGDVKRNEFRAYLGLPPDETADDHRAPLLDTVGGMTGAVQILTAYGQGLITADSATALLATFFQIDAEAARKLVGEPRQAAAEALPQPTPVEAEDEADELADAVRALRKAVDAVTMSPSARAEAILAGETA